VSKPLEPHTAPLGGKPSKDAKLPSKKALDFLTHKPPAQQRIQQFGELTPTGSGFQSTPRGKKGGFSWL
jgi:hypothetical protein